MLFFLVTMKQYFFFLYTIFIIWLYLVKTKFLFNEICIPTKIK